MVPDTANAVVRPPLLFLGSLVVGAVLDRLLPLAFPIDGRVIGGVMVVIGIAVFVASVRNFGRADTPVPGNQPTRALVITGIHGFSRNPIYVGMFLFYTGIGIGTGSLWTLILLLPIAITMRYGVVAREEIYLEQRFGDAYRGYKARVRRWI